MPRSYDSDEAIRRWDLHARHIVTYVDPEGGDPHRIVLLNPALFQLLPDVDGKRVLDAGCGEGYLCRKLAWLGARVTHSESHIGPAVYPPRYQGLLLEQFVQEGFYSLKDLL
jgi:2-polyprenyl-3-methyl-5-hydroxy-6-metoxy-1,4-benzoquinol methylase